jgi:hypothetical protein
MIATAHTNDRLPVEELAVMEAGNITIFAFQRFRWQRS